MWKCSECKLYVCGLCGKCLETPKHRYSREGPQKCPIPFTKVSHSFVRSFVRSFVHSFIHSMSTNQARTIVILSPLPLPPLNCSDAVETCKCRIYCSRLFRNTSANSQTVCKKQRMESNSLTSCLLVKVHYQCFILFNASLMTLSTRKKN